MNPNRSGFVCSSSPAVRIHAIDSSVCSPPTQATLLSACVSDAALSLRARVL
ncbi:histamine H1 receptor [Sesbania bispinosa]|nr:histamine H1 receptor [Sesbania bispinosa]